MWDNICSWGNTGNGKEEESQSQVLERLALQKEKSNGCSEASYVCGNFFLVQWIYCQTWSRLSNCRFWWPLTTFCRLKALDMMAADGWYNDWRIEAGSLLKIGVKLASSCHSKFDKRKTPIKISRCHCSCLAHANLVIIDPTDGATSIKEVEGKEGWQLLLQGPETGCVNAIYL